MSLDHFATLLTQLRNCDLTPASAPFNELERALEAGIITWLQLGITFAEFEKLKTDYKHAQARDWLYRARQAVESGEPVAQNYAALLAQAIKYNNINPNKVESGLSMHELKKLQDNITLKK